MADLTAYRLQLLGPFHSSSQGIGIETTEATIRSDTLFSALASAIRAVHGADWLSWLLECCRTEPPFIVSSMFPWAGGVRFFPRPRRLRRPEPETGGDERTQTAAKARWVSQGILDRILAGQTAGPAETSADAGHGVWFHRGEQQDLPPTDTAWWGAELAPRVAVDRATSRSAVYRCGRFWYGAAAGLWFAVDWRDREWEPFFDEALAYLGEAGLGGERSAGHGQFRLLDQTPLRLAEQPAASGLLTLSLYHPTAAEARAGALAPPAAYDLEVRRGWVTSPDGAGVWRKAVRMVAEGSVVQRVLPRLGDLVDVTPSGPAPHQVYRAGFAVGLGMLLPGDRQ